MIQRFADRLVYGVFGMSAETHFGSAVNFFFYDSVKILILLFLISMVMGIVNAYFPIDNLRHYLATRKLYGFQYLFASLFGAITPFCSCSSIPLFIGFVKGGIPLGVTFAFLITSPLVNEVAVAMFLGSFGMRATAIYVVSGILLGMIGGFVLGRAIFRRGCGSCRRSPIRNRKFGPKSARRSFDGFPSLCAMRGVLCGVCWYMC